MRTPVKFRDRYPYYVKLGFALVVLFGIVGNFAGRREGSVIVFILVSVLWSCSRILQEGIEALSVLRGFQSPKDDRRPDDDKRPPGPPTTA